MNPCDDLVFPAVLTPWVVRLAEAEDVDGLVRLFNLIRAMQEMT